MTKIALVIGGTGGLGRASAIALAAKGYTLIVAGRNASKGDEVVKAIHDTGATASFIAVDLKDRQSIKDLHAKVISTYGQLDVAVNAAGILSRLKKAADVSEEEFDSIVAVNITGFYISMQEQIRVMLPKKSGHIINVSSVFGMTGCKFASAYATSKHAVVGMTRSAAIDYAAAGIYINALAPGIIPTEMVLSITAEMTAPDADPEIKSIDLASFYPVGRFGQPQDVGKAVVYLADNDWVTGTVLTLDGGATAGMNV